MNPKDMMKAKLAQLKAAKTDRKEDALETENRKSPVGKKANAAYHKSMPKKEVLADLKEDMSKPQTKNMKADIKEDMKYAKQRGIV